MELDWGDPTFSRRLLLEHLDQSHDGASRRERVVDEQVRRLRRLLPAPPARLLDAACGPGLYAVRLARLGYTVEGVDVGPAVVAHARKVARVEGVADRCAFRTGDLRTLTVDEPCDAVLLIYYVLENLPRRAQTTALRRLAAALKPGGVLVAELRIRPDQPPGRLTAWDVVDRSLLADRRHLLLTETVYDDRRNTYVLRETAVFDDGSVAVQQTTGSFTPLAGIAPLFARAGLRVTAIYDGWSRYRATELSNAVLVVATREP